MPVDWDCVGGAWGVLVGGASDVIGGYRDYSPYEGGPIPEDVLLTNQALWLKYQQPRSPLKRRYCFEVHMI